MYNLREGIFKLFIAFSILNAADSAPPQIPEVQAVKNHEKITLMWDSKAENSIDPLTGYSDFAGYRIYRSTDGGITWGTPQDKIFDFLGNHVGWKPYAQFDLIAELDSLHCIYSNKYFEEGGEDCASDLCSGGLQCTRGQNINGYDPIANWVNLGNNTGLVRSFVDSTVLDGVEYTYAVTAYDMGMKSFNVDFINDATIDGTLEDCEKTGDEALDKSKCKAYTHCYWDENACKYTDDDYCSGCSVISEFCCDNSDTIEVLCDGKESFCDCTNGTPECSELFNTESLCEGQASGGVWTIIKYATDQSCEIDLHGFSLQGGLGVDDPTGVYASVGGCDGVINTFSSTCDQDFLGHPISDICPVTCGYTITGCDTLIVLGLDGEVTGLSSNLFAGPGGEEIQLDYFTNDVVDPCELDDNSIQVTNTGIVLYNTDTPILSFQFNVIDANVDTAFGGNSEVAGFQIFYSDYEWEEATYSDEAICEDASYDWQLVDYLTEDLCVNAGNAWTTIYFSPDTVWIPPKSSNNPGHFTGRDYSSDYLELWGYPSFESPRLYESYSDYNSNNKWDAGEPFTDCDVDDLGDPICEDDENWDDTTFGNGIWDKRINPINVVTMQSGYKASNITFPAETPEIEFIFSDTTKSVLNRGNGDRLYNIVNEYDLTDAVLRFEINAGLEGQAFGDSTGSFATKDPSLYIYEVISLNNFNPKNTYDISVEDINADDVDSLLGLPGVNYNAGDTLPDGSLSKITMPIYKIEDFNLTYIDDPLYASHYTEWFDGIQFRFDNGPNKLNDVLSLVEIKQLTYSNSLLKDIMGIKMKYNAPIDIAKRPMYRYRIDFSASTFLDTAGYGTGRICEIDGYPDSIHTLLPFKITNITSGKLVDLDHKDNGIQDGYITYDEAEGGCVATCLSGQICFEGKCVDRVGNDDCSWQHNEVIESTDIVFSDQYLDGRKDKLFDFKIDFDFMAYAVRHEPNYFGEVFWTTGWDWKEGKVYDKSDLVFYRGMLYRSNQAVVDSIPPTQWFDDNGDKINDNVWQMLYPWNDEDYIIIEPYGWYQDGDAWVTDLSVIGKLDENSADDLQLISVVPNPYIVNADHFNESSGNHLLRFTRLPTECDISIYTVSGEFVTVISHNDPFDSNEWWDMKNGHNQEVAPGLYIYAVETPSGNKKIGKFAIVR